MNESVDPQKTTIKVAVVIHQNRPLKNFNKNKQNQKEAKNKHRDDTAKMQKETH